MNLSKEIYKAVRAHCGTKKVEGITDTTLRQLEQGKGNPTLKTIKKLFQENGMPSSLTISHNKGGILTTTTINLWKE